MSKTKEVLRRTGRFTQEERVTYRLQYKFELADRFVYADQQAIDRFGAVFEESKEGKWTSGHSGSVSEAVMKLFKENKFEIGDFTKVIETEADYE